MIRPTTCDDDSFRFEGVPATQVRIGCVKGRPSQGAIHFPTETGDRPDNVITETCDDPDILVTETRDGPDNRVTETGDQPDETPPGSRHVQQGGRSDERQEAETMPPN